MSTFEARNRAVTDRYAAKPYRFVPPNRGTALCRLARPLWGWQRRRLQGVAAIDWHGVENLQASLVAGCGIVLAANHSRWADASVMGNLSVVVRHFFYYLVSSHLLRSGWHAWLLRQLGSVSVLREGTDHDAMRFCAGVLATAERPLVIFPEGTWFRQNDRLGELQDGLNVIVKRAVKANGRPIVVHPVAIKYWLIGRPDSALDHRLKQLERHWGVASRGSFLDRIDAVTAAVTAARETAWGLPRGTGAQNERIANVVNGRIAQLAGPYNGRPYNDPPLAQIRWLRVRLVRMLAEGSPAGHTQARAALEDLLTCENLLAHDFAYLHEQPTPERMVEAVERLDETTSDAAERPPVPLRAEVSVLPPIAATDYPDLRGPNAVTTPLTQQLAAELRRLAARATN